jgi:hypothetical protein
MRRIPARESALVRWAAAARGDNVKAMKTIHSTVNEIFAACPELCGFSVQHATDLTRDRAAGQLEGDLYLADVETLPYARNERLFGEIAVALLDLIDERPETVELLRGRTFARTLH